jgi:ABC-type bacteriocin/lantibiotic exporter with double-glycine peptidase domain
VAIAGASGSGKSTLARLIVGLYQPSQGRVLHGGHPIADIPRDVFTTQVAWVDQEVVLFEGTVFDNLTLWDTVVPRENVLRAARDACIHDVIAALPLGYETQVREAGLNFSGGQRQRLEIARALVPDPALLVLDEATAALDPITEMAIHENLRRRGVTCIIVAHRLSAVRDCDDIVVLTRGRIAEQGRHASLLARNGVYASLVGAA